MMMNLIAIQSAAKAKAQQALDATCQGGNGDSNGEVGIFEGMGMFTLLLITVIAAVTF